MLSCRAKSRSQAANLPGTRPSMKPLKNFKRRTLDFHSEADCFSLRAKDSITLKKKYARTNVLKYSFSIELLTSGINYRYRHSCF